MTVIYRFPWELAVASEGFKLDQKVALNDPPMSDGVRGQNLSNGRFRSTLALPTNNRIETAKGRNVQLLVNGFANRFKVPDFRRMAPQGSAKTSNAELNPNPNFANGTTGYTFQNNDAATRVTSLGKLKLVAAGVTLPGISVQIAVVNTVKYVVRLYSEMGTAPGLILGVGTTAFGTTIAATGVIVTDTYTELQFTAAATGNYFVNVQFSGTTAAKMYAMLNYLSIHQCALINGANQSGQKLLVKGLPVSTNGFLLSDDVIEISNHIYEVLDDVDSDGSGNATINLQPNLRSTTLADATSINLVACAPVCLMKNGIDVSISPGPYGSFNFEAIEDLNS